jgi:hypothetical protein
MPQKIAAMITKCNARHQCVACGSTERIQAHHQVRRDDSSLVALCAECHSKRHPNVPHDLFFSKNHQPYWHNKSASSLAKELGLHPRTIIRTAKKLRIAVGDLSLSDEELIKAKIPKLHREKKEVHIKKTKPEKREEIDMTKGIEQLRQYLMSHMPRRKGHCEIANS